jgi:hypothetical protein
MDEPATMVSGTDRQQHKWPKMQQPQQKKEEDDHIVRYHCGGWSEEVNSCILIISYMVYS